MSTLFHGIEYVRQKSRDGLGIKRAASENDAAMAKLGWAIQDGNNRKPWVEDMKKITCMVGLSMRRDRGEMAHLCGEPCKEGKSCLRRTLSWGVGNG